MSNPFLQRIDPAHANFALFDHPFVQTIWRDKYRWQDEKDPGESFARVANALYYGDDSEQRVLAYNAMRAGLWMPGGRIIAGAGTSKRVTLLNCYVSPLLEDDLDSIMAGVSVAAVTQQQGGGIGIDFSTLRPEGAILHRTGGRASGPIPFMDMWHAMCSTIMSAGDRRGAMMGTICDTHPDLLKFITAKHKQGRLTNFNVSVLVSDAFMEAVKENAEWLLHFSVEPKDGSYGTFIDDDGVTQYIYKAIDAREVWKQITKSTYEYSEPGVIFIDRINQMNNLKYCEEIHCTNPCGEQPLPPNGCCNLGAVNLSRMVHKPFTEEAEFDYDLLRDITALGVGFLDRVIDVTGYPTEQQKEEELDKRRLGLGVSGLADCLAQLKIRYGSSRAVECTDKIFMNLANAAYRASVERAKDKGSFPMSDPVMLEDDTFVAQRIDYDTIKDIRKYGIRNGMLLTVAPTGTTSILFGNCSSGIEPVFDHAPTRNVRQPDNTFKKHETAGYGAALYRSIFPYEPGSKEPLPGYMVTADDLSIEDHITMQATAQRWIDASVSKTCNVSKETTYEQFVKVYDLAYALGCKGCTTYRPSPVRGAILERSDQAPQTVLQPERLMSRPTVLFGATHKIKWPSMFASLYLTINYSEDRTPFEVFLSSKDGKHHDWMTATSLMITSILRKGGDVSFIAEELKQVHSFGDTAFVQAPGDDKPRFYGSLPAYIGAVLGSYLIKDPLPKKAITTNNPCPHCKTPGLIHAEGCQSCPSCGYSDCG